MNKRKVLITGGAGFIGSHLADELMKGYKEEIHTSKATYETVEIRDVTVLDNMSAGRLDNIKHLLDNPGFRFIAGNVCNRDHVLKASVGCDYIFHLASIVGIKKVLSHPVECAQVAMDGTINVMEAAIMNGVKKVFIASSSQVYGPNPGICKEDDMNYILPQSPVWIYATVKALSEYIAKEYQRQQGIGIIIGRFFNVIGSRQSSEGGHVVPTYFKAAMKGLPLQIYGKGTQERAFIWIDDVVDAMVKLMDNDKAQGVFNIGTETAILAMDLLSYMIVKLTKSKSKAENILYEHAYGDPNYVDVTSRIPDIKKIRDMIEFKPTEDIGEILKKYYLAIK